MLIGLYGPSRAGKDSVAQILVDDFGYEQRAQAAAIRKILLGLNAPVKLNDGTYRTMRELYDYCGGDWDKVKAESKDSVDQMIALGQTCRDVIGLDVWLNTALPPANSTAKIVISDVRQPNEYAAIRERGGKLWKIIRPGVEMRGMDGLLDTEHFDATLHNRGSLVDLRGMVQATIASMYEFDRVKGKGYGGTYGG